ncbi:hypothetical protein BG005_010408 [Podila minutissima]|nr:hypothetical protein BG005_010408 [Podila minutissima]
MLKKKRFSGLFGAGLTDIPSPGPEQQQQTETAAHSVSRGFSPQMLSSQGRQSSMSTLSTTTGIMGGFGQNNKNEGDASSTRASDEANTLTRAEVHQSLENLKKLVIAAESYRELTSKLAKTTKQLGKCFKEYGDSKGMDSTYVMCLKSSANFYESFSEMESKLATCLQKDFEQLQHNWEKHSKRVTKDEKAHDEVLGDLDERIKKISLNYDKKNKKPDPNTALGSHEKYISTLAELQDSIAVAKRDHRNTVARREKYTHSLTSQIACRLAEAQFLAIERQLRGSGPSLVKIKEWAPYAGIDMPPPTLVTSGDPSIDIRAGTFEEYSARHPISQREADQGRSNGIGLTSPQSPPVPVVTLTEMPQITLPPFAPMQQYLQQQEQQQQPQPQQYQIQQQDTSTMQGPPNATFSPTPSRLPPTMPIPQPLPTSMPVPTLPIQLPTTMPEPQKYIPQPTPKAIVIASDDKPTPVPPTIVAPVDHKVLVTEPVNTLGKLVIAQPTSVTAPTTIVKEMALTTSPPSTPGAFPVTDPTTVTASLELKAQGTGGRDGSFPEDQASVITKVDSGGSTTDRMKELGGYPEERVKRDDEVLEAYHQDDYVNRYGYPDERSDQYREARRLDTERDDLDHSSDELYNDPYSPTSDRHQYYGDGDDMSRVEPRRYFDDDDSQHSGTISALQSREREYYGRSRYDDGQSDRSYQRYSSSVPRHQHYTHERHQDELGWDSPLESSEMTGYAREQYPTTRECPTRPTLEDRELEMEMMKQKAASSSNLFSGGGGPPSNYPRRPANSQGGTVAHLRRRFSDQNVAEMGAPPLGQRPRGMSGTGVSLQSPVGDYRRDARYPPRTSTPQSRAVATPSYIYEKNGKGGSNGKIGAGGTGARYGSDYEGSVSGGGYTRRRP